MRVAASTSLALMLWNVPIGPAVAVFLLLAAIDHLLMAAPGIWPWYRDNIARQINKARWWEYSISASLMVVLIAMLAGGNVLLEGVPGLGKTMLVRALSQTLGLHFSRIQFTPDLMPSDILGTTILVESDDGQKAFRFERGPIFANIVLADEINRATPKTQSAMLEAMQEHSVTVGKDTMQLEDPFFVLATQNPLEMDGTYPLPEAQLDRFLFKLIVRFPDREDLHMIMDRTTQRTTPDLDEVVQKERLVQMKMFARDVPVARHIQDYALRLLLATHPEDAGAPDITKRSVFSGRCAVQRAALAALPPGLHWRYTHIGDGPLRAGCT